MIKKKLTRKTIYEETFLRTDFLVAVTILRIYKNRTHKNIRTIQLNNNINERRKKAKKLMQKKVFVYFSYFVNIFSVDFIDHKFAYLQSEKMI